MCKAKTLAADGKIATLTIDTDVVEMAKGLPYMPDRYFLMEPGSVAIPVANLILSRARPEGIRNAISLMNQAFNGTASKRSPLTIVELGEDRHLIIDGNSTAVVAIAAGWPDIQCKNR